MRGDLYNGSEGTDRLADILKDDVDDFLASSDESDFVFYESDRLLPKPRRFFETLFQRGETRQTSVAARRYAFSIIFLSIVAVGVCFFLLHGFHSPSLDNQGPQNIEIACEEKEQENLALETEPTPFLFSPKNFYGRGIEALDTFSKKYWMDEVDVILGMTDYLTSWGEADELAYSLQTPNRYKDGAPILEDDEVTSRLETFSPQEIVLATVSVSMLVFTIEKFYNTTETGRRTEL